MGRRKQRGDVNAVLPEGAWILGTKHVGDSNKYECRIAGSWPPELQEKLGLSYNASMNGTKAEAAAGHDLFIMWRQHKAGKPLHHVTFNLGLKAYDELQAGVLACKTNKALQEYVVKLRDEGTLARLAAAAVAGAAAAAQAGGGGGGPAAPTTTADEEEWWGDEEEGDEGEEPAAKRARHAKRAPQQAQPPPPAQQPPAQPASSSARTHRFRWITGYQSSTNWACQVHVNPALLTEGYKQQAAGAKIWVGGFTSAEQAAVAGDLGQMWLLEAYGKALDNVKLNFERGLYGSANGEACMERVQLAQNAKEVVEAVQELRDDGLIAELAESPEAKPMGAAPAPQSRGRVQHGGEDSSGRAQRGGGGGGGVVVVESLTFKDAAVAVLSAQDPPRLMPAAELALTALQVENFKSTGATPEATMAGVLHADVKRKDSAFIRFVNKRKSVFGLRKWADQGIVFKDEFGQKMEATAAEEAEGAGGALQHHAAAAAAAHAAGDAVQHRGIAAAAAETGEETEVIDITGEEDEPAGALETAALAAAPPTAAPPGPAAKPAPAPAAAAPQPAARQAAAPVAAQRAPRALGQGAEALPTTAAAAAAAQAPHEQEGGDAEEARERARTSAGGSARTHSFQFISQAGNGWQCQVHVNMKLLQGEYRQPEAPGKVKVAGFPSEKQAAVAADLGQTWLRQAYGKLHAGDLNFEPGLYGSDAGKACVDRVLQARGSKEAIEALRELRDSGQIAELAASPAAVAAPRKAALPASPPGAGPAAAVLPPAVLTAAAAKQEADSLPSTAPALGGAESLEGMKAELVELLSRTPDVAGTDIAAFTAKFIFRSDPSERRVTYTTLMGYAAQGQLDMEGDIYECRLQGIWPISLRERLGMSYEFVMRGVKGDGTLARVAAAATGRTDLAPPAAALAAVPAAAEEAVGGDAELGAGDDFEEEAEEEQSAAKRRRASDEHGSAGSAGRGGGGGSRKIKVTRFTSAEQAAVAGDLGQMWLRGAYGKALGDIKLNFQPGLYGSGVGVACMERVQRATSPQKASAALKELRDEGLIAELAGSAAAVRSFRTSGERGSRGGRGSAAPDPGDPVLHHDAGAAAAAAAVAAGAAAAAAAAAAEEEDEEDEEGEDVDIVGEGEAPAAPAAAEGLVAALPAAAAAAPEEVAWGADSLPLPAPALGGAESLEGMKAELVALLSRTPGVAGTDVAAFTALFIFRSTPSERRVTYTTLMGYAAQGQLDMVHMFVRHATER
ncbi:Tctex1 domain-containing 2 [Micractinium conductrix]|uniref:Tctex1 domain-containing 2 n=1 Tax=Micractinium conductrix TaxID=554055 RepID=A0A2P6VKL8_9CHLO|nr:Tctex1 domain-containing 2 [Micractinium conductrix]|eukprot:PSC74624.1 Tctex1 domain-containing 2 [Micractinium conductrix]